MVGADLQLEALGSVQKGGHHDSCVEDQEVQASLRAVDVLSAGLHYAQVSQVQPLDRNGSLQSELGWFHIKPCIKLRSDCNFGQQLNLQMQFVMMSFLS